jgi:signal transduction histidine kinase
MNLAMSAAELGLWEWDIVHDEIWSTDNGRDLYGIDRTEKISFDRFLKTLCPEDREPINLALDKSLASRANYEGEYRVMLPDGRIRWLAVSSRMELNNRGLPLRMHGVSIDITRRKHAELDVQKQRNELARLSRATMLGELSGSLAHELNQPLAATGCVEHRQFHIQTLWHGDAVQVSVGDQGQGIALDDMERIFEPFFTTKPQGMGLGLAICRTIITAHNGQLWATNNADCGASFYFTLPSYPKEST